MPRPHRSGKPRVLGHHMPVSAFPQPHRVLSHCLRSKPRCCRTVRVPPHRCPIVATSQSVELIVVATSGLVGCAEEHTTTSAGILEQPGITDGDEQGSRAIQRITRTCRASLSVLAGKYLLWGLPDAALDRLIGRGHTRRFARNEVMSRRGDPGEPCEVIAVHVGDLLPTLVAHPEALLENHSGPV